ncbi:hypothetical protein I7I51_06870 [Histoplasma capsulatum]|uniref:Uncharacterized protein n=2 Tax=Histoplasma TaxID=5036 RepID=A0A8A1MJD7_AJECA|nr:hypothetical protein I7I51_06870 [Histoplasma capsulatum]
MVPTHRAEIPDIYTATTSTTPLSLIQYIYFIETGMSEPAPNIVRLTSDVTEILGLGVISFWLSDYELDNDDDKYNAILEEVDGRLFGDDCLFVGIYMPSIMPTPAYVHDYDTPDIWDTGRAVIARYRRVDGGLEIVRDAAGAKIVDLFVLPWSRQERVAKERLMERHTLAPVLCIGDWRLVRFMQRFHEDMAGRQLGLLAIWQQVERALDVKEDMWIHD